MGDPSPKSSNTLVFYVNGKKVEDNAVDPEWTLLYYLRNKLRLCGTKLGCAEGGCGACTVMVSKIDRKTNQLIHLAVNACLAPICSLHGTAVTTVEGIGSTKTRLHPVQERIAKAHGSQCGFCTPGIVMSMYALLRNLPKPSMADLEIAFQGNLCRCTGYRPIIEGFRSFTEDWEVAHMQNGINGASQCGMGDQCCKKMKTLNSQTEEILFNRNEFAPYDPSQEPIFPPELKISPKFDEEFLAIRGKRTTWYRPTSLEELLNLKANFPNAKIVVGNTEVGVEVKFKNFHYPVLIQPNLIRELMSIEEVDGGFRIGAAVTLNEIDETFQTVLKEKPEHQTRIFKAIVEMLHWFAGKQIRNVAAIGGNIMTGSPISDLNPILLAARVTLIVQNQNGQRLLKFDENFFTGYRRNVVQPDEVLIAVIIPFTQPDHYFYAFKQAKRRDDDIAIVNCAADIRLKPNTSVIEELNIAYGGMAPTTVLAVKTRERMRGKEFNEETLQEIYSSLIEDLPLSPSAPGGMIQYRRALTLSFVFKVFLKLISTLSQRGVIKHSLPKHLESAADGFHFKPLKSSQYFQVVPEDQPGIDPVGRPIVHASAYKQATGEAIYCDDIPHFDRELYLSLVVSTRAHAIIKNIDAARALALPGVVRFFSYKDIDPDKNHMGPIFHDEEVFCSKEVLSQGCVLGAIVAEDQMTAQRAAKLVDVEYEDKKPVIITIEDAIREKSFLIQPKSLVHGDPEGALKTAELQRSGEVRIGGQEHFYLETQCTVAVPKKEDDEMEVYCSTQHAAETQKFIALTLGIPFNRVVVHVKRLGGAFGGKEARANVVAVPVAFAAHRLGRPVRCMLDRDEDMLVTGGRHPFLARYQVGFTKSGRITALQMDLYNNAGCSFDLSTAVMDRAAFHFTNSYNILNSKVTKHVCKTNLPTNTAFRGFGAPQANFFAETVIREVAEAVGKPVEEIISLNLYEEGDITNFNQKLTHCTLRRCFDECMAKSDFANKKSQILQFNRENRYKKRGISVVPTTFGISFTELFLNQAAALVHVYTDGSVLLSHGGTEMGQGLHTKMIQVASRVLGIPAKDIYIAEMATDKTANTTPTAASSGSDLNGMAVMEACQKLVERLKPFKEKNPGGKWADWVMAAHFARVSLSATGFYTTPDIGYNPETNSGMAFNYFTYGVAVSTVEIDCLTGDHQVLSTDIVMDLGESLNPAIDIGQIEGAFMQGYGLFTLEELMYSPQGALYTRGPGMYKIPGFSDIPAEFNVSLLRGAPNPRAVYSSKAVGEPPLFLACSIFFAIKDAIAAAREEVGLKGHFRLDSPATAARIRMACDDSITKRFPEPDLKTYEPWNVVP